MSAFALGEGDPAAETQWCRDGFPLNRDLQIGARNIHLEHAIFEIAGLAEGRHQQLVIGWQFLAEGCTHTNKHDQKCGE